MTQGTSTHGGGLSGHWTDVGHDRADGARRRPTAGGDWRIEWAGPAGGAAPLQLLALSAVAGLALGLMINTSWPAAAGGGSAGAGALHLAALIAICAIVAVIGLRPGGQVAPPPRQDDGASERPSQLLAQMHHELRTPLNAMIGFSEVMLRELHGPLGNACYQDYVAHISESGGRLLKASEDALAVAATMLALVADRRDLRRDRLPAGALLREAWAASGAPDKNIQLRMDDGAAAQIECDRQATSEALQHLLDEAVTRTPPGGTITARGAQCRIEIVVEPVAAARERVGSLADCSGQQAGHSAGGDGLRLILARSLIEMQGAALNLSTADQAEGWTACIAFSAPPHGQWTRSVAESRAR
jgi:signal transduction histidine kinase